MANDFSSRAGTAMTAVAWVLFLAFLFTTFDYFIDQRNAYGHYITNGTINNQPVVFLLDTGATEIAIPEAVANKIGLIKNQPIRIKTANGVATAYRTKIDSAAVGGIKRHNLNATILKNMHGNEVLLGMNFLKHFEIIQKGKFLTIKQ